MATPAAASEGSGSSIAAVTKNYAENVTGKARAKFEEEYNRCTWRRVMEVAAAILAIALVAVAVVAVIVHYPAATSAFFSVLSAAAVVSFVLLIVAGVMRYRETHAKVNEEVVVEPAASEEPPALSEPAKDPNPFGGEEGEKE